jgi:hypothetical protein
MRTHTASHGDGLHGLHPPAVPDPFQAREQEREGEQRLSAPTEPAGRRRDPVRDGEDQRRGQQHAGRPLLQDVRREEQREGRARGDGAGQRPRSGAPRDPEGQEGRQPHVQDRGVPPARQTETLVSNGRLTLYARGWGASTPVNARRRADAGRSAVAVAAAVLPSSHGAVRPGFPGRGLPGHGGREGQPCSCPCRS